MRDEAKKELEKLQREISEADQESRALSEKSEMIRLAIITE